MATRCRPLLGTFVEIAAPDASAEAIDAAFEAVAHVHRTMSFHEPDSDLARLHAKPPGEVVQVDRETAHVLAFAADLYRATGGLFNVAVGRVLVRSGFLPHDGVGHLSRFPGDGADIAVLDDTHVRLRRRVLIDLGGIAKGHAVDRAVETLMALGVTEGLVNAGGDLRVFGACDQRVQLRDADGLVRHMVEVRDCAIASSANLLNRRRVRGQVRSPHVGRDGAPVLADQRISVVAPTCILADAMTKVALADPALAHRLLTARSGQLLSELGQAEAA